MSANIDFYFDFSSPYGYLASTRIDALAAKHGRSVDWHPILLGVVFKVSGSAPLLSYPLKSDYAKRDMARSARALGVAFQLPSTFPIATQSPARLTVWAQQADAPRAKRLAAALYRAYFAQDRDISNPDICADVAAAEGYQRAEALAGLNAAGIKDKLRAEMEAAIARGVFGSPYVIVDGEAFWGADRLDQVERWMATGGW
ncbi:MAG: 2-hydroxychromene-2-carboxylate isomerase [Burkholderiales bacterium]|nr:2-hydroxychromene-2-carboxylate isomerase [Burkholderiales bacterium]